MSFTHALSTNNYGCARLIVSSSAANGTHTTLASALAAASSGDTVFLRDSVTENVTIPAGVNVAAWQGSNLNTPSITGKVTMTAAGTSTISGIKLVTNSDFCIAVTGSAASILRFVNCYINCSNNTGISFTSSDASSQINCFNCMGDIGTTGITLYSSSSAGSLGFRQCLITNSGSSTTASSNSAGIVNAQFCGFNFPFSTSSTGLINFNDTTIQLATNTTCITTAGTGATNGFIGGRLDSGTATAVSVGSGTTLTMTGCSVNTSNVTAIGGAGTLIHSGIAYFGSSSVIGTTTITNNGFGRTGTFTPGIAFGGGTTGITYSVQAGTYTMIGNVMFINIRIVLSNKGSSTGNATITGLPVTNGTIDTGIPVNSINTITLTATFTSVSLQLDASATTASLVQSNPVGGGTASITDANFANTSALRVSACYLIA